MTLTGRAVRIKAEPETEYVFLAFGESAGSTIAILECVADGEVVTVYPGCLKFIRD